MIVSNTKLTLSSLLSRKLAFFGFKKYLTSLQIICVELRIFLIAIVWRLWSTSMHLYEKRFWKDARSFFSFKRFIKTDLAFTCGYQCKKCQSKCHSEHGKLFLLKKTSGRRVKNGRKKGLCFATYLCNLANIANIQSWIQECINLTPF